MKRLAHLPTLRVDPARRLSLTFEGRPYQGYAGDTIATALFADGVRIFGRSLKYHRPRGLYSLDGECSNTCVAVDGIPNVRAETTLLKDGMRVTAQNVKGSARFDLMGFMDKLDWLMPAGFYYRTLHKPAAIWPIAMKQVRKAAGLGTLSPDFKMPGRYDEIYPTAEICVIGGGPAGMAAALAAAESGLRVILLEARPWLGGCFDYRLRPDRNGQPLYEQARELARQVAASPHIRVFHSHRHGGRLQQQPDHRLPGGGRRRSLRRALHRDTGPKRGGGHRLHRAAVAVRPQRASGCDAAGMRPAPGAHVRHSAR